MGVRVVGVSPQSPAAQAGIRPGDTILEVDGRSVESPRQLASVIQENTQVGETAECAVIRGGREISIPVRVATREQVLSPEQRQGEGLFGREPRESGRLGQNRESNRYQSGQQGQQFSQQGQQSAQGYGEQRQYDRQYGAGQSGQSNQPWQQGQYSQNRGGYGQPGGGQYRGSYNPNRGYSDEYGNQDSGERGQVGERLVQRLQQLEGRFQRLEQRLEQLVRERERSDSAANASYEEERSTSDRSSSGNSDQEDSSSQSSSENR
jgi:hypothetical protein